MPASFAIERHDGLVDGSIQVFGSREGLTSKMMTLQVAPEFFDVIELWSIFRQPLDPEPVRPLLKRGPRQLAGVDRAVVHDQANRLDRGAGHGTIAAVALLPKRDAVRTPAGSAGAPGGVAKLPVHQGAAGHVRSPARRRNAQI